MADTLIISWDQLGVECVFNASEQDRQMTFEILAGTYDERSPRHSPQSLLNLFLLRARINNHRHYEVYAIEVEEGISADDIKQMFEDSPQSSADLIRSRGRKLYSNRQSETDIKIR